MDNWIEIKEGCELPKEETYCILRTVSNKAIICGEGYWFQAGAKKVWRFTRWPGEVLKEKTVTHWMDMPEFSDPK